MSRAMEIFDMMRHSQNYLPNVITFVTIFRALGKANLHEVNAKETCKIVLDLLKCAQEISADDRSSLPNGLESENTFGVVVDITIYNAALSTCVWLNYPVTAEVILLDMAERKSRLNAVSFKIISKLVTRCIDGSKEGVDNCKLKGFDIRDGGMLKHLASVGAINASEAEEVRKFITVQQSSKMNVEVSAKGASSHSSGQYAGCLGPDATEDLRQCVIDHDLRKLIERPEGFSESDFATLIHQCRKRKWPNQVNFVLSFMTQRVSVAEETSSMFNPSPSTPSTSHPWLSAESSYNLRRCIVALTWTIYEAALDAYFCMDMSDEAFALYKLVLHESADSPALRKSLLYQDNIAFLLKGFLRCGRADCAVFAFESYSATCPPCRQLVMGIMHGLGMGNNFRMALCILSKLFNDSFCTVEGELESLKVVDDSFPPAELNLETVPFSLQSCKTFLIILLESCAVLGNIDGIKHILSISALSSASLGENDVLVGGNAEIVEQSSYTSMLLRDLIDSEDCDFVSVCLMACASHSNVTDAHDLLFSWQSPPLMYLPPYLFLHSLVAESFAQTTSSVSQVDAVSRINSLPYRGFARFGAVRHLDKRRNFIRQTIPKLRSRRNKSITSTGSIFHKNPPAIIHVDISIFDERANKGWRSYMYYILGEKEADLSRNIGFVEDPVSDIVNKCDKMVLQCVPNSNEHEEDLLLTQYLLAVFGFDNCKEVANIVLTVEYRSDHALSCLLLLQHLETRLLKVRDKDAKGLLQRQITITFSVILQTAATASQREICSTDMISYARHLVKYSLHVLIILDLNGKQSSRLLSTLLEGTECWCLCRAELFDGLLLHNLSIAAPCLEVIKELHRMFLILDIKEGATTVSAILLSLLENDREKLVKVVMFMQQQHLLAVVDLCKLESLLIAALRNSPDGSWSAVTAYMTGMGEVRSSNSLERVAVANQSCVLGTRDACRRLVRQLLSSEDKGNRDNINIACRLLCKYEISDDIEFRDLFVSVRDGNSVSTTYVSTISETTEEGAQYFSPYYPRSNILWIDGSDMDLISRASDILFGSSFELKGCDIVGIDVEWRPYSTGCLPWPCSLLQIGCRTHCFLFDLLALDQLQSRVKSPIPFYDIKGDEQRINMHFLETSISSGNGSGNGNGSGSIDSLAASAISTLLSSLFTNSSILKLGFGLSGDFKRLESSYPGCNMYAFSSLVNIYDIASAPICKGRGLSAVSFEVLGRSVDKRFQMSDWQRRPLSEDQVDYAATDAGVLIAIYDAMRSSQLLG